MKDSPRECETHTDHWNTGDDEIPERFDRAHPLKSANGSGAECSDAGESEEAFPTHARVYQVEGLRGCGDGIETMSKGGVRCVVVCTGVPFDPWPRSDYRATRSFGVFLGSYERTAGWPSEYLGVTYYGSKENLLACTVQMSTCAYARCASVLPLRVFRGKMSGIRKSLMQ